MVVVHGERIVPGAQLPPKLLDLPSPPCRFLGDPLEADQFGAEVVT